ncbi:MAG TPA: hypothetical protein VFI17_06455 [Solirubrobacterales bacterium]|nr:hypothetical protein [Solirubrobacterales bacterium]
MTRNIKALGLALIAVFAMSAWIASAAQAAPTVTLKDTNGATVGTADFTGEETEGKHKFTVDGSSVECANVAFSGTITDGETWTTVTPSYTECTAFGFLGATVSTAGCDYKLMANAENAADTYSGEIEVFCNTGNAITITAGGVCEAKVNSGTVINTGTTATNITGLSHEHLKLHNVNSEVKTEKTKDGFGCPFNGTGTVNNATYNGHTTVKAYVDGSAHNAANQVNITLMP